MTLDTFENTPTFQLQHSNNVVTLDQHGNSTAAKGNNCSRNIQDKHRGAEETKQWICSQIMKMLAPPQRFENAPEKVRPDHQTNGFSQWLLCFIICENSFFSTGAA